MTKRKKASVIIGAGAPHASLLAGALTQVYRAGKTFNNIYTSGSGILVGLLFCAPRGVEAPEALEALGTAGVHDSIYQYFPLAYRVFYKSGPFTESFYRLGAMLQSKRMPRLYNDLVGMWASAMTPSTVSWSSKGLCGPCPWVNDVIAFEKLKNFTGRFYATAYNITTRKAQVFHDKKQFGIDQFNACLAYPFIYSPTYINGQAFYEGATIDPLNLPHYHEALGSHHHSGESPPGLTVMMDILGSHGPALIREPRNLLDAYGLSIITPIVSLSEAKFAQYATERLERDKSVKADALGKLYEYREDPEHKFLKMNFRIPERFWPNVLDWSHSNMVNMWQTGLEIGQMLVDEYGEMLPDRASGSANAKGT
jgi:hypothetical protein